MFLSEKVAMEILCASVSRDAQKKQQEPQTLKKCPPGIFLTKIEGGASESPHWDSHKIEFPKEAYRSNSGLKGGPL